MPQDAPPNDQHHDDEDQDSGWTIIGHKHKRKTRGSIKDLPKRKTRTTDLRSVEELDADYRRIRARFEEETCCKQLREIVAKNAVPSMKISRAINLGIGTFDPVDLSWAAMRASYVQLIAFLIMVEEIEKITGQEIKCVFQEPAFTQSDKDFVASLGHEVVEDPAACDMVNESSFLFSVHLYRPIYARALKNHLPAIFVGTGWTAWDKISQTDGIENMEEFERSYNVYNFPKDTYGYAFSSTGIYWKPSPWEATQATKEKETKELKRDEPSTAEDEIVDKLESTALS
ncbi:Fc.00g035090.m01.CDS01 [Cosmosporella sp. VM-42]